MSESVSTDHQPRSYRVAVPGRGQDCGVRCLYVLCKAAGKQVHLAQIREHIPKTQRSKEDGTSMLELKLAADRLGFAVDGVRCGWDELSRHVHSVEGYAILHLERDHFLVATSMAADRIRIVDPSGAIEDVSQKELRSTRYGWAGNTLLLRKVR